MINAKDELLEELNNIDNANVLCAIIETNDRQVTLPVGYTDSDFEKFMTKLDFSYDYGYKAIQYIDGTIWLSDGTWLSRNEYDGSEYWEQNYRPAIPDTLKTGSTDMTGRRLTVIALTGATGSGKDTLAAKLVTDYGYTKLSYGAVLRAKVTDDFGECHDERDLTYCPYGSFKDAMLCYGKMLALKSPADLSYLMTFQLQNHIAEQGYNCPVVITDLRKPIELDALLRTPELDLWLIEITRKGNPYKPERLDNLLSGHLASQRYADAKLKRERLVQPSATIENNGSPADMVDRLSLILELTLPYRTGA